MDSLSFIIKLNECTSASTCWCDPNITYGKHLIETDMFFKMLNDWILFGMENKTENVIGEILDYCISLNDTRCINKDTFMKIYSNTLKPLGKNIRKISKGKDSDFLKEKAKQVLSMWGALKSATTDRVSSAGSSTNSTSSSTSSTSKQPKDHKQHFDPLKDSATTNPLKQRVKQSVSNTSTRSSTSSSSSSTSPTISIISSIVARIPSTKHDRMTSSSYSSTKDDSDKQNADDDALCLPAIAPFVMDISCTRARRSADERLARIRSRPSRSEARKRSRLRWKAEPHLTTVVHFDNKESGSLLYIYYILVFHIIYILFSLFIFSFIVSYYFSF